MRCCAFIPSFIVLRVIDFQPNFSQYLLPSHLPPSSPGFVAMGLNSPMRKLELSVNFSSLGLSSLSPCSKNLMSILRSYMDIYFLS